MLPYIGDEGVVDNDGVAEPSAPANRSFSLMYHMLLVLFDRSMAFVAVLSLRFKNTPVRCEFIKLNQATAPRSTRKPQMK